MKRNVQASFQGFIVPEKGWVNSLPLEMGILDQWTQHWFSICQPDSVCKIHFPAAEHRSCCRDRAPPALCLCHIERTMFNGAGDKYMKTWQKLHDPKLRQTSFYVIADLSERVSVGGGYLAAKRVTVEGSLSSELSGVGEAICTDRGGLSQRGLVLWSTGWGQTTRREIPPLPGSLVISYIKTSRFSRLVILCKLKIIKTNRDVYVYAGLLGPY